MPTYRILIRVTMLIFTAIFILVNLLAYFQASRFTRFDTTGVKARTSDAPGLSFPEKVSTLLFGINNPRPVNLAQPHCTFETIRLKSRQEIECWSIRCDESRGTVILFHGYSGEKSELLDKAAVFRILGYNTLLVDFMGSGGSQGNQTTIGYYEADDVRAAFEYVHSKGEGNIILFGTSMGAVAVMKALNDYHLGPSSVILECPFGSMLETVEARFRAMNIPAFPLASLLVFWGGWLNGFNAFRHNPVDYARNIRCPALLLYGELDPKVSRSEIDAIFRNLGGFSQLRTYPGAGHENYLLKYANEWTKDIGSFLTAAEARHHSSAA